MYPTDDAAFRLRLLARQVEEVTARVAEELQRAQDARATSQYVISELHRVRRQVRR